MKDPDAHSIPGGENGRVERRLLFLLLAGLVLPFAFGSCAPFQNGAGIAEDPPNRIDWAMLGGPRGSRALPMGGTFPVPPGPPRPPAPLHLPEHKLHEQLRALVLATPPPPSGTLIEVLVTFRDTLQIPRFPERVPPGSPKFRTREAAVQNLIQSIRGQRAADYDTLDDSLAVYGTIHDRDSHWLLRAMVMEVRVDRLLPLALFPQVVYIQPRYAGELPPWGGANTISADNPQQARDQLAAEPYFTSYGDGTIGLVDTGVYTGHNLLAPDRIGETWNCLTGACVSEPGGLWEACPNGPGHGTGSAALLSGNGSMGITHRGFTRATINAYKAYRTILDLSGVCSAELDGHAAALGIQKSVAKGDRVILVETQSTAADWAAIAQEADRAYRSGSVVIAPVGNLGAGNIGSPGNARGSIAVGAYAVDGGAWSTGSSYGLTENRYKPDLEAPTNCETAGGPLPNEMTAMGRTSGAGPMVAGASLLLRNFMMGTYGSIDAGKIYAALILAGTETADFAKHGAGRMRLFETGHMIDWGKVDLASGIGQPIDLSVTDPATQRIAAAVWWPENLEFDGLGYPLDLHNDVEIELYPPGSAVPVPYTAHFEGVFERIVADVNGRVGVWKLHIIPKDFVTAKQTVFWALGRDPVTPAMAMASQTSTSGGCGCSSGGCSP